MDRGALPPLAMLRAFEAAARHLSFSAAGRELNVTHVAVGQQVRKLEAHLGLSLVARSGRSLELTPDGARLAARLIESFDGLRDAFAEIEEEKRGRPLRVTLTPMFAGSWLMPRLGAFRSAHPDIELMLNPTPDLIDLRREDYDLAIRYGARDWPGLETEAFMPSGFAVIAAPKLLEGIRLASPTDLAHLPWILQQGIEEFWVWLADHGVEVGGKRDISHLPGYMVIPAARDGQGVALVSRVLAEEDIRAGQLVALFEDGWRGESGGGYFLVHRPGPLRAPARQFVRWLKQEAAADRAAAEGERPSEGS